MNLEPPVNVQQPSPVPVSTLSPGDTFTEPDQSHGVWLVASPVDAPSQPPAGATRAVRLADGKVYDYAAGVAVYPAAYRAVPA